jgi:hypothetical protein
MHAPTLLFRVVHADSVILHLRLGKPVPFHTLCRLIWGAATNAKTPPPAGGRRPEDSEMTPLDAALNYAARDWPIFPVRFNRDPLAEKFH